jgi:hypothetical protein
MKIEQFGEAFVEEIRGWCLANGMPTDVRLGTRGRGR